MPRKALDFLTQRFGPVVVILGDNSVAVFGRDGVEVYFDSLEKASIWMKNYSLTACGEN